jgi:hypothetical protein
MESRPDRLLIYLVLALVCSAIASISGPSAALLTLFLIIAVVEAVNLIAAPGDEPSRDFKF